MAFNPKSISRRTRKLVAWLAAAVLFYTYWFFSFAAIIRHVAVKELSEQLGREVSIRQVKLNPYDFSTTICGLMIKDHDGQPFLSWMKFM